MNSGKILLGVLAELLLALAWESYLLRTKVPLLVRKFRKKARTMLKD
jgi:hypothetical protein